MGEHVDAGLGWAGRRNFPQPGLANGTAIGREEILMVRQQDHSIKAFFNVCQHRDNPLVDEQKRATRVGSSVVTTAGPFCPTADWLH